MLADQDIAAAIESKRLMVEPFSPSQLRPAGLTLHLGAELLQPRPQGVIDLQAGDPEIEYDRTLLGPNDVFVLEPKAFVLAHTFERVSVGEGLGLLVEGRSTFARLGVSVVQAAMVIDTGHRDRPITLELFNAGPSPVALRLGMPVSRAIVFELKSLPSRLYDDYGRYAHQREGVGVPLADAA